MSRYDVEVTREGKWWMVAIPALDGLTQARRVSEVEYMARDYIAVNLDVPIGEVEVSVHLADIAGVSDLLELSAAMTAREAEADAVKAEVARERTRIAKSLAAVAVPYRDVGSLIGLSPQRAQQLSTAK